MDVPPDETADPALFECALAELLHAGVAADMRPLVQKFQDDPAAVAAAFTLLPPKVQEELGGIFGRRATLRATTGSATRSSPRRSARSRSH